jgi:hypothetical protein
MPHSSPAQTAQLNNATVLTRVSSHHTTCLLFVDVLTANAIVFVPLFLLPRFVVPEWREISLAEPTYARNRAFAFFFNIPEVFLDY